MFKTIVENMSTGCPFSGDRFSPWSSFGATSQVIDMSQTVDGGVADTFYTTRTNSLSPQQRTTKVGPGERC